jgi:hypothetical protein
MFCCAEQKSNHTRLSEKTSQVIKEYIQRPQLCKLYISNPDDIFVVWSKNQITQDFQKKQAKS